MEKSELSKELLNEYKEAFAVFDKNGNERIKIEHAILAFRYVGLCPSIEKLNEMINETSRDGDEEMDLFEFLTLAEYFEKEMKGRTLK